MFTYPITLMAPSGPSPLVDFFEVEVTTTGLSQDMTIEFIGNAGMTIEWGDGNTDVMSLSTITHTYDDIDIYNIRMGGDCGKFSFDNSNAQAAVTGINSVINGIVNINDCSSMFELCTNLIGEIPAGLFDNCPGALDFEATFFDTGLSGPIPANLFDQNTLVTSFGGTFLLSPSLTSIPAGLFDNCPNVLIFSNVFNSCVGITSGVPAGLFDNNPLVTSFKYAFVGMAIAVLPPNLLDNNPNMQDLEGMFSSCGIDTANASTWDIGSVTTMEFLFSGCDITTDEYDDILVAWESQAHQTGVTFHISSEYTTGGAAEAARDALILDSWVINDDGGIPPVVVSDSFDLEIEITTAPQTMEFRLYNNNGADIDWGDGSTETQSSNFVNSHSYSTNGTYTLKISESNTYRFQVSGVGIVALNEVLSPIPPSIPGITVLDNMFQGCNNITQIPSGFLDNCTLATSALFFIGYTANVGTIPVGLFDNCPLLVNASYAFYNSTSLNTLPDDLFINQTLTSVTGCFQGTAITSIPADLFQGQSVTNFTQTFKGCPITTIPAGLFDGIALTNLSEAFATSSLTVSNAADWDISACTNVYFALYNSTLTTADYDALLISWEGQTHLPNLTAHFGNAKYTGGGVAAQARADLVSDGWSLTDGGIA
jgi:hypothetical protein